MLVELLRIYNFMFAFGPNFGLTDDEMWTIHLVKWIYTFHWHYENVERKLPKSFELYGAHSSYTNTICNDAFYFHLCCRRRRRHRIYSYFISETDEWLFSTLKITLMPVYAMAFYWSGDPVKSIVETHPHNGRLCSLVDAFAIGLRNATTGNARAKVCPRTQYVNANYEMENKRKHCVCVTGSQQENRMNSKISWAPIPMEWCTPACT